MAKDSSVKTQQMKNKNMSGVWCHPNVQKTEQSNLSRNNSVNTLFLAKIYTIAS